MTGHSNAEGTARLSFPITSSRVDSLSLALYYQQPPELLPQIYAETNVNPDSYFSKQTD